MSIGIPAASLRAEIGVDGEVASTAALTRFGGKIEQTSAKSTASLGRIGVAARTVDQQLAHFGVPFTGTAGRVITSFEGIERRGTSLGSTLSNLGRAESTAAVVGLAAVATEGVHLADTFELAHARLEVASKNAGLEFDDLSGAVKTTDKNMEALGFTNADTESSLARLLTRTKDMAKAQRDEQIAADYARFANTDLASATKVLVQIEAGRYTLLSRSGIASKEQIAGFKDSADAIGFLANITKNQASTAATTFAGKMKVLSAEGQDLGTTLGLAVVPNIEKAASGALAGVHTFQDFNSATNGVAGKVVFLGAALPIAVFGLEKLGTAGLAVSGVYTRVAGIFTTTAVAEDAMAAGAGTAAAAEVELGAAGEVAAAGSTAAAVAATSALAAGAGLAGGLVYLGGVYKNADDVTHHNIISLKGWASTIAYTAQLLPGASLAATIWGHSLGLLPGLHKKNADAAKEDALATAQDTLAKAKEKLANDQLSGNTKDLAADKAAVTAASRVLAGAEGVVNDAVNAGTPALDANAGAAQKGAYAYLGLADAVTTAAGALAGSIQLATSAASSPFQLALDTSAAQASALALHGKIDTPAGGGGGGQTATAAALDQAQKELALRDAQRQVQTTTTGITQAQHQLTDAREQATTANQALTAAETNYRNVLNGVAASSKIAQAAQAALTQAQRDARASALDVQDAERNLALARSDSRLNGFGVTDAEATLTTSRGAADTANQSVAAAESELAEVRATGTSTAEDVAAAEQAVAAARAAAAPLNEQVTKDEVALDDARINAKAGAESITRAELELGNQRAAAKQKTTDLNAAQRTYTDTLKGYPKTSAEAKAATDQLRAAQDQARQATDGVVSATQALVAAQDQVATSALGVQHAQADLDGKLKASAGAGGGMGKLESRAATLATKLDDLRQKSIAVATDMAANITAATGSYGQGIEAFIESLRAAVANEPLLTGAFDSVIAHLQSDYAKWVNHLTTDQQIKQHVFGPTTGGVAPGYGPTRDLNPTTKGHAAGGFIAAGETSTVGEAGFELVRARPGGGVDVLSNPQSRHALSGSNSDGALLAEVRKLNATLANMRPGVHVDTIIARDAEDTMRKIDQQQKRLYLLTNL